MTKKYNIVVKPDIRKGLRKWAAEDDTTSIALVDSILRERLAEVGYLE